MYRSLMGTVALTVCGLSAVAADYPRGELIAEPAPLAKALPAGKHVVLDARAKDQYEAGHLPTAVWVDHGEWAKAFGEGEDAAAWSKRIAALGIHAESSVVVYDASHTKDAARIWWILRYWGVRDVKLLNGGWIGWEKGQFPVETTCPEIKPTQFQATAAPDRLAKKDDLLKSLTNRSFQIVDARTEAEHCGIEPLKNKRSGSIPGAKLLEWIDLLDLETHRFKSPAELKSLFQTAGIELDRPTATHCQSGGRAAVMAFGLELMGAKEVRNYYKSWSEWGNDDDTPIVQPKSKK